MLEGICIAYHKCLLVTAMVATRGFSLPSINTSFETQ